MKPPHRQGEMFATGVTDRRGALLMKELGKEVRQSPGKVNKHVIPVLT